MLAGVFFFGRGLVTQCVSKRYAIARLAFPKKQGLHQVPTLNSSIVLVTKAAHACVASHAPVKNSIPMTHSIWEYDIPMPASDVYIALMTVASFLPAVLIVDRLIGFVVKRLSSKKSKQC